MNMRKRELAEAMDKLNKLYLDDKVQSIEYTDLKKCIEKSFKGFHVIFIQGVCDVYMFKKSHVLVLKK